MTYPTTIAALQKDIDSQHQTSKPRGTRVCSQPPPTTSRLAGLVIFPPSPPYPPPLPPHRV
ncbi:hypothetical protein BO82DRAFT_355409, partial [Aspergillus uvarum CBS 121591]